MGAQPDGVAAPYLRAVSLWDASCISWWLLSGRERGPVGDAGVWPLRARRWWGGYIRRGRQALAAQISSNVEPCRRRYKRESEGKARTPLTCHSQTLTRAPPPRATHPPPCSSGPSLLS